MEVKRGVTIKRDRNFEKDEKALMDGRNTEELMTMLGLEESLDRMAKVSSMQRCGHILRREDNNVLLKARHFELLDRIGRGRPKQTWEKQVEKEMHKMDK